VDTDPIPDIVIAGETYGPDEWAGSYYHIVFVSDVTSLVQSGSCSYTISGTGLTFTENYGAGLVVVCEVLSCPYLTSLLMTGWIPYTVNMRHLKVTIVR
jgi:hypothetical protein